MDKGRHSDAKHLLETLDSPCYWAREEEKLKKIPRITKTEIETKALNVKAQLTVHKIRHKKLRGIWKRQLCVSARTKKI